jgi:hypothetical protein
VIMVSALPGPRLSGLASVTPAAAVGGFPLLAVLVYVADEHPAAYAGVGALQAGVVGLYGVVMILGGWVRVGCARLCSVHSSVPTFLWAGLRGVLPPAGPFLYLTPSF